MYEIFLAIYKYYLAVKIDKFCLDKSDVFVSDKNKPAEYQAHHGDGQQGEELHQVAVATPQPLMYQVQEHHQHQHLDLELTQQHQHLDLPPQAPGHHHHHQDIKDLHRHPHWKLFWNQIHAT